MGSHSFLQGIFPTQGLNPGLLHFRQILYHLSYQGAPDAKEAEAAWFFEDLQDLLELTPRKDILLFQGDWNAKVGNQEIPGVTLGVQNEAAERLTVLPRDFMGQSNPPFPKAQEDSTHGLHQTVNAKIRMIIFFAAKDGEALYSLQKQDWS